MTFPLTRTIDPARDEIALAPELALVDRVGIGEQHPMRRYEYAMALRALSEHRKGYTPLTPAGYILMDVGGAGSPFKAICDRLEDTPPTQCAVVDPRLDPKGPGIPHTLEGFLDTLTGTLYLAGVDAVVSISTIEHVKDPLPFLEACHRALAPGGLLFLTTDYWDQSGPDTAHFHWMRERIYNAFTWGYLSGNCMMMGFREFGGVDLTYHGSHLYGSYTFASLALTKEA
jgi:Methyltransferase domain